MSTGGGGPGPPGPKPPETMSQEDRNPGNQSTTSSTENVQANQQGNQSGPTWAAVSRDMKEYKLLIINFERSENYNISEEEIARLVFKKLEVPRERIRGIDVNANGKIILEIEKDFDETKIPLHHSHEVRRGLRTQAKLNHLNMDNQVWVKIYRTTFQDSDDAILDMLRPFGRFTSNLQRLTYQKRESGSEELKLLGGVQKGDRTVRMALSKPCPTWQWLEREDGSGHRVKVTHFGQRRTCARCNQFATDCKGGGDAQKCEDADKSFVKPNNKEAYIAWASQNDTLDIGLDFSDASILEIRNLPNDVSHQELAIWMAKYDCVIEVDQIEVPPDARPGVRNINGISTDDKKMFVRNLDNRNFKLGKRIRLTAVVKIGDDTIIPAVTVSP